jgi:hypothetical protein
MTRNPLINAFIALVYIVLVSSVFFFGSELAGPVDTIIAPMAMISLFTLSAAVMGYVFGYQPFVLYFDGKKKAAVDLFLKTVACFGLVTLVLLFLLFSGVLTFF